MKAESSDETIRRFLSGYEIGAKLNHLRLRKKIALADLGRHTGLSASLLSQLENGKLVPTLPTLSRIAMVFDVGLDYFFSNTREQRVFSIVRSKERILFPERPDMAEPSYVFEQLNFHVQDKIMHSYLAEFPIRKSREWSMHMHEGHEFLHLLQGELLIRFGEEDHLLATGDSAYFDSAEPHGYQGMSEPPARAMVVVTPPRDSHPD